MLESVVADNSSAALSGTCFDGVVGVENYSTTELSHLGSCFSINLIYKMYNLHQKRKSDRAIKSFR